MSISHIIPYIWVWTSQKYEPQKTVKRTWIPVINILQPRHRLFFLALEHGDLGSLALCNLAHGLLLHHSHRFHCLHSGRFHGLHDGLLHCQCHGGAMRDSWVSLRAGCKWAAVWSCSFWSAESKQIQTLWKDPTITYGGTSRIAATLN